MSTRCRFAPSPTGLLHIGGARTALFNLLFARASQGRYILRSEDTDRRRSTPEAEAAIIEDLRWLGLQPDEGPELAGEHGPYRQSERLPLYREAVERLLRAGLAYEAWETSEELQSMREAAQSEHGGFRYRRPSYSPEDLQRFYQEGRAPVIRLRLPDEGVVFEDLILGSVEQSLEDMDEFVIIKADGFPTYHFAVVVDDHHMGITHVLRAQEHLLNTTKHIRLYEALGWDPPAHGHMPLIFSHDGRKMSKRDKAREARAALRQSGRSVEETAADLGMEEEVLRAFMKKKSDSVDLAEAIAELLGTSLPEIDVRDFKRAGYLPEALVNFLALLGWNPGGEQEIFTLDELIELFTLDRMGRTAARFDRDKLRWMNASHLRALSTEAVLPRLREYLAGRDLPLSREGDERLLALIELYKERIQTFGDLEEQTRYFFTDPSSWGPPKALKKHLREPGQRLLRLAGDRLKQLDTWSLEGLEQCLSELVAEEAEGKMGKVAQPLRIAVTGTPVSPPIFDTLFWLGRDACLRRIESCLEALSQ